MRKRRLYQKKLKPKSYVSTIILMAIALFVVIYIGKGKSDAIARFFAPSAPVVDAREIPGETLTDFDSDAPADDPTIADDNPNLKPFSLRCGTILAGASKNAAANLLLIIQKGTRP